MLRYVAMFFLAVAIFWGCQSKEIMSAKLYMQEERFELAAENARMAIEKDSTNADAWLLLGEIYAHLDSIDKMIRALDKAVELKPSTKNRANEIRSAKWAEYFNEGVTLGKKKQYEKAIEKTLIAYRIDSTRAQAPENLVYFYSQTGTKDKALRFAKRAYQLDPKNTSMALNLSTLYISHDEIPKAISILKEVRSRNPELPEVYKILAMAYDQVGKQDSALWANKQYLKIDPDDEESNFRVGVIHYEAGELEEAKESFLKVLKINPDNVDAAYNIGVIALKQENYDTAIKYFTDVITKNEENLKAWDKLSIAYLKKGDTKTARAYANYSEAIYQMNQGTDISRIKELLNKALKLKPDFPQAKEKLEQISK